MSPRPSLRFVPFTALASALCLVGACDPTDGYDDLGPEDDAVQSSPFRGGGWEIDPIGTAIYCGDADLEHREDDSGAMVVVYYGGLAGPIAELAPTDPDGEFCVLLQPNTTYGVRFFAGDERYLDVAGIWTTPAEAAPMPDAMFRLGDLDGNDVIDELDGSILASALDCDGVAAPAIFEDLDADGVVCDGDLAIVEDNQGLEGPLAWIFGGGGIVVY